MGAWSGEPFGNDVATDWSWELEDAQDWNIVRAALDDAVTPQHPLDEDIAAIALAAAEVVARGLGRPTQDDAYTEDATAFVARVQPPSPELVTVARSAVARAGDAAGPLARTWAECGDEAWREALDRIAEALHS